MGKINSVEEQLRAELRLAREKIADYDRLQTSVIQLKKERDLAQSVLDNIQCAFVILNDELEIVSANETFYKNFRVDPSKTIGKSLSALGNSQWNIPNLCDRLKEVSYKKEKLQNFEVTHDFESIGKRTMQLNATPLEATIKSNHLILLEIQDITTSVKAQNRLEESIHRYHELVYSSPSFIAILSGRDLIVEIANDAILENWGKGKDVVGKPLIKEVLPEMVEQGMEEIFMNVFDTGEPFHAHEMPLYHKKNGEMQLGYFDFVYQPQRDMSGEISGIAIIATNVTEQAELHQQVKQNERKFRQTADLVPDKISTANPDGSTFYYNKSWLDYSGYSLEELKTLGWQTLVHPEDREKIDHHLEESLRAGTNFEMEMRCLSKEGDYKWHLIRAVQVKDESGNLKNWISSSTEIHKLKEEEKRKENFLKLVSHELKTPVTSIKGYVQLLLTMLNTGQEVPVDSMPLKSSLQRIDIQISRLTRLISEMLDLSRMEEGRLDLNNEIFGMNQVVEESVQDINNSIPKSQIKVIQDDHFIVQGDKDRIGQVIINLITNAIKYSSENKNVEVRIFRGKDGTGSVSVRDYGIGIKAEDHVNIFKRFYRVSDDKEETYPGFGIGLYLANEIIRRHNGYIELKSKPGEGSEFIFSLPVVEEKT